MCFFKKKGKTSIDSSTSTNILINKYKKAYFDLLNIVDNDASPITAAFLYIVTDFIRSKNNASERQGNSELIFTFLETELNPSDLTIFDKSVDLLGAVVRGSVQARGDWLMGRAKQGDQLHDLWLCYGDLLQDKNYLENYAEAPVRVLPILEAIFFANNLIRVKEYILDYIKEIRSPRE